nr:restriction endonuclease subunit S [Marinobacter nauticus]
MWTGAVTKKSSSGRGSNGKLELTGVKKLRELILSLAVRGKLVPQNSEGPSAASLLVDIEAKKKELYHAKIVKKPKKLCQPQSDEAPWPLPSSWEWVKLPDIYYPISPSGKKLKSSETLDIGQFPVVDQGQSYISGYTDDASLVIEIPHPVIVFGDHTTARKYIDFSFVPGADGTKILCPILVNPRFFYLQLLGYDLENRGYARHFKVLNENFFALPPLEEQHRIVQKVDELMALCDRLEQQTSDQLDAHETLVDTLLGTLTQSENATELADNWARLATHFDTLFTTEQSIDKLKQTILQLAVMGRLVEQDAGDESAATLLQSIENQKGELIKSGAIKHSKPLPPVSQEDHPFRLPNGWGCHRLGGLVTKLGSGSTPRGGQRAYVDDGIPFLRSQNVWNEGLRLEDIVYISEDTHARMSNTVVYPKDILLNITGASLGRSTIFPDHIPEANVSQHVTIIRLIEPAMTSFVHLCIQSPLIQSLVWGRQVGMAIEGLSKKVLERFEMPIPPLEEQHRIVQKVDELMALCDQLKERLNQASETRNQLAEAVVEGALN